MNTKCVCFKKFKGYTYEMQSIGFDLMIPANDEKNILTKNHSVFDTEGFEQKESAQNDQGSSPWKCWTGPAGEGGERSADRGIGPPRRGQGQTAAWNCEGCTSPEAKTQKPGKGEMLGKIGMIGEVCWDGVFFLFFVVAKKPINLSRFKIWAPRPLV